MTLIAVPLNPLNVTDKTATTLLDGMLSVPAIFTTPGTQEERRILIASVLSDPLNRVWLVWNDSTLLGCLLLTAIIPKVDAQCHLVFFDRTLFGRRNLVWNLMGKVFADLDLQRLTVEIPEYLTPLYKFVRNRLHYRLEGEAWAATHPLVTDKLSPSVANAAAWCARVGSRRERACWNPEKNEWADAIRLRILRSEYESVVGAPLRQGETHVVRPAESGSPR